MTGLNSCTFIDKTREPPNTYQECRDVVVIGEWTDRIYATTPNEHIITNVVSGKTNLHIYASAPVKNILVVP